MARVTFGLYDDEDGPPVEIPVTIYVDEDPEDILDVLRAQHVTPDDREHRR